MTDDLDPVDDDLGTRLRTGLDLLAREAGEPPALDVAQPATLAARSRPAVPRWAPAAAVLVIAVLAGTVAFALSRSGSDQQVTSADPTASPQGSRPLMGTRWWLTSANDRGTEIALPSEGTRSLELQFLDGGSCEGMDPDLCYDGPRVEGSDGCNGVSRKMTIDGDTIALGEGYGAHTLMECGDPLADALQGFFRADRFTYAIDGDQMVLTSPAGDVVLTYEAIDTPFGPTSSPVVDEGDIAGHPYRLVWLDDGLSFQVADRGNAGVGADPGRVNAMLETIDGESYLFGIVPADAAGVVYEPLRGTPQEIQVVDVDGAESAVIGQFVHEAPGSWDLVAYDASGNEIHRLRWNPQS